MYNNFMPITDFPNSFFKYIEKQSNGCWNWTGRITPHGYGLFLICGYSLPSHRISFEYYKFKIPKKAVIDHLCRNRRCVNPDHLEAVSQKINVHRGEGVAATNIKKTHCVHGHEYTSENTIILKWGYRECRTCRKNHVILYRQRHLEKCRAAARNYASKHREKNAKISRDYYHKKKLLNQSLSVSQ